MCTVMFYLLIYLNLKREVLLQVLDDHDEEWQLDAERFCWICRTRQKCCAANIGQEVMQLAFKTPNLLQQGTGIGRHKFIATNCHKFWHQQHDGSG